MSKDSTESSFLCRSVKFLAPIFIIIVVYLVCYREQKHLEAPAPNISKLDKSAYHDTLQVNYSVSSLNPKLSESEEIWRKYLSLRKATEPEFRTIGSSQIIFNVLRYFSFMFVCPFTTEFIGDGYDGGWTCGLELFKKDEDCVFYSIRGSRSKDATFETELLVKTDNCRVYAYSLQEIKVNSSLQHRFEYKQLKTTPSKSTSADIVLPKLSSLLQNNGHGWIDILKIDLGSLSFSMMDAIIQDTDEVLPFGQLQIRLTFTSEQSFDYYMNWFGRLEAQGLRQFHSFCEQLNCDNSTIRTFTCEHSFMNLGGKHALLRTHS